MKRRLIPILLIPLLIGTTAADCQAGTKPKPTHTRVKTYGGCKRLGQRLRAHGYLHQCELVRNKRQWVRIPDKESG